jgi:hypothetical protein
LYVTRPGKWHFVQDVLLLTRRRLPTPVVARPTGTILGSPTRNHGPPMGNRQCPSRQRNRYPTVRHLWDHQGFRPTRSSLADYGGVCAASFRQRYRDCAGFGNGFADQSDFGDESESGTRPGADGREDASGSKKVELGSGAVDFVFRSAFSAECAPR